MTIIKNLIKQANPKQEMIIIKNLIKQATERFFPPKSLFLIVRKDTKRLSKLILDIWIINCLITEDEFSSSMQGIYIFLDRSSINHYPYYALYAIPNFNLFYLWLI
jgi:hypothetical protein